MTPSADSGLAVAPPEPIDAGRVEAAEAQARELYLNQLRASLPAYLDIDEAGDVVPAEGFRMCPACKGTTVIPDAAPQSPEHASCPFCEGWGQVSTGSRLSETANIMCPGCNGNGYVEKAVWLSTHPEDTELFGKRESD